MPSVFRLANRWQWHFGAFPLSIQDLGKLPVAFHLRTNFVARVPCVRAFDYALQVSRSIAIPRAYGCKVMALA